MDSVYILSTGSHFLFTIATIVVLATWPHCRSRLPLILSLVLTTVQTAMWVVLMLIQSVHQGAGGLTEWFMVARVTSLGVSILSPLLLLIFAVLMGTELRDLLLAAEGPDGAGGMPPSLGEASPDATRDPRYETRFDARHDTRHDPRNDPGYHPRQDG